MTKSADSCIKPSSNTSTLGVNLNFHRQAAKYLGIGEERVRELSALKRNPLPAIWLAGSKYPLYTKELLREYVHGLATVSKHN